MGYLFSAIISWFTHIILDKIFKREKTNEEIIKLRTELINQIEEKDTQLIKLSDENKTILKEKQRIIDSIKRSGLSTEKLVEHYSKTLNAILISCYDQKSPDGTNYGKKEKFLFTELEQYNGKHLGSGVYLIPPINVPKGIKNRNDLELWFNEKILKGRYCTLKFLILFDLRKKAYWKNILPYKQTHRRNYTLGDVLKIDDLFSEEQIKTTTIDNIIRNGDIGWLAYNYLSENEFIILRDNLNNVEKSLGNPSLRILAEDSMIDKISKEFSDIGINNPLEISKAVVSEAKFWNSKLSV